MSVRLVQKSVRQVAGGENRVVYRYECPSCTEVFESSDRRPTEVSCPGCESG